MTYTDFLAHPTTQKGVPITVCDTCGKRHPVTRRHCSRCLSWSAFQTGGLCLRCTEPVAPQWDTGRGEVHNGGECGTMGGGSETGPNRTLATSNPGPDRDSTPSSGRGNRG